MISWIITVVLPLLLFIIGTTLTIWLSKFKPPERLAKLTSRQWKAILNLLIVICTLILMFGLLPLMIKPETQSFSPETYEQPTPTISFEYYDRSITVGTRGTARVKWHNMPPHCFLLKVSLTIDHLGLEYHAESLSQIQQDGECDREITIPGDSKVGYGGRFIARFCDKEGQLIRRESTATDVAILPQIAVLTPKEGAINLGSTLTINGTVEGQLQDAKLWLIVRPRSSGLYYPLQWPSDILTSTWTDEVSLSEDWTPHILFGPSPGEELDIIVSLADKTGQSQLETYRLKGQHIGLWRGLYELPIGVTEISRTTIHAID